MAAFYHMFGISRGVKLITFEPCLLFIAFTIIVGNVHEVTIQLSYCAFWTCT